MWMTFGGCRVGPSVWTLESGLVVECSNLTQHLLNWLLPLVFLTSTWCHLCDECSQTFPVFTCFTASVYILVSLQNWRIEDGVDLGTRLATPGEWQSVWSWVSAVGLYISQAISIEPWTWWTMQLRVHFNQELERMLPTSLAQREGERWPVSHDQGDTYKYCHLSYVTENYYKLWSLSTPCCWAHDIY